MRETILFPGRAGRGAAFASAAVAVLIAGCAGMKGLAPAGTAIDPSSLQAQRTVDAAHFSPGDWPHQDWWKSFGDPQLDRLIDEALAQSPTVREAKARTDRAVALAGVAGAALYPQVAAGVDVNRQRYSENGIFPPPIAGAWYTQSELSLEFNYEFDFWGKNRAALNAALGEQHAAEVDAFAARLLLAANVTHAYVRLQRAQEQLEVARATLAQREGILSLTQQRVRAGLDSRIDMKQAEAAVPAIRQRITQLEEESNLSRNLLAALLGAGPDRGLNIGPPRMQAPAHTIPARLPADLVGRRPDVVAGRWRVESAKEQITAAKAQFYPNVNLAALVGVQSVEPGKLLERGSAIPLVDAAVHLPIFEGGRLRSNLAARDAEYDMAVEQYNQTVVDALREVVDQLTSLRSADVQQSQVSDALAAAQEAYDLSAKRYAAGLGSYLQVLIAEGQVLDERTLAVDLRVRSLDLSINLMRGLGGGYE